MGSTSYMRESFVEGLLRKAVPQSKVAARLRLNVLCWYTSQVCKYRTTSAVVMAAAMTSCPSTTLGIDRLTSAYARRAYELMMAMALIQSRSLELHYQNF